MLRGKPINPGLHAWKMLWFQLRIELIISGELIAYLRRLPWGNIIGWTRLLTP